MELASRRWEQSLKELENEFRQLIRALDLIVELDRSIFQTSFELDALLDAMLKGLRDLVGAEYAQILLRRGSTLIIVHSTNPEDRGKGFRIEECVCGLAVEERRVVSSGNVGRDYPERYKWRLGLDEDNKVKMISEVAVPIYVPAVGGVSAEDRIVAGVINIESPLPDAFFDSQRVEIIEKFALQAGAAINNARIHKGLALTLQLAENIQAHDLQPNEALRHTLEQLSVLFQEGVIVQFLIHEPASGSLVIESSTAEGTEGMGVLVDDSFSGLVIKLGTACRSNDVRRDFPQLFKDTVGDAGHSPTQSELAVPIKEDGRIIGVLNVESPERDAFSKYDEYMLNVIASNASLWTHIYKSKSLIALEKMATVGIVASHLVHTVKNGLTPLKRIADTIDAISESSDPSVRERLLEQTSALRKVAPTVFDSVNKLDEMYTRALEPNQSININDEARKVVGELVTREDINVRWELDPDIPTLHISGGIYHIFWNLVSNAKRAIPEELPGEITVGTKVVLGQYTKQIEAFEIYVSDTGVGIPPDEIEKVRSLEYTSKPDSKTGYGLWWVDTFVTRWNGKIYIESKVGRGTTVRIWFPLTPEGVAPQL